MTLEIVLWLVCGIGFIIFCSGSCYNFIVELRKKECKKRKLVIAGLGIIWYGSLAIANFTLFFDTMFGPTNINQIFIIVLGTCVAISIATMVDVALKN